VDSVTIFKQRMTAAILARPENTPESRDAVYRKTREFLTFSKHAHLGSALETAIAELEREFHTAEQPEETVAAQPAARKRFDWRALPRPSRRVVAGAAIAAAIGVTAFLLLYRPPSDPEFDRGFADYSSSARGFESIPPWTTYYSAGAEGDLRFVEATGPVPLYSKQVFAVTPGQSYKVSARIRVMVDDPAKGGAMSMVGTVSYDDRGNPIGPDIAPAQYCAMQQKIIKAADGWTAGEGILTFDNTNPDCLLPPGTVSVRLVALLNVSSPTAVSQIDYLRFEPVTP
jgi:hypothetical protein